MFTTNSVTDVTLVFNRVPCACTVWWGLCWVALVAVLNSLACWLSIFSMFFFFFNPNLFLKSELIHFKV